MEAPTIRAVLFDFDGTLSDSEYLHYECWLEAAADWGSAVDWESYKRDFVGISDRNACRIFLEKAGLEPADEAIAAGCLRKHQCYRRRAPAELTIDARVVEWIRAAAPKVPLGVVSSSAVPDVAPTLELCGIAGAMRFAICGDHAARLKPDPMPYLLALEKLRKDAGVEHASECLVFEDSATGIASASAAGMTVHPLDDPARLADALAEWEPRIDALRDRR